MKNETTYNNGQTILQDDRTAEQHETHKYLVTATDKFMSGWGRASGGNSKCAWACTRENLDDVLRWVESRDDMKYVNVNSSGSWRPRNAKHVHIYVVTENHPSIK